MLRKKLLVVTLASLLVLPCVGVLAEEPFGLEADSGEVAAQTGDVGADAADSGAAVQDDEGETQDDLAVADADDADADESVEAGDTTETDEPSLLSLTSELPTDESDVDAQIGDAAYTDDGDEADIELYSTVDDKLHITGTFMYDYALQQFNLTNEQRTAAGKSKLVMSKSLQQAAMQRAAEIAIYFSHTRPNGTSCFTAFPSGSTHSGENIASGQTSPSSVTTSWMNSSGHKANILGSYTSVGIGCVKLGNNYYWVQCFGTLTDQGYVATTARTETKTVEVSYDYVSHSLYGLNSSTSKNDPESITIGSTYQLKVEVASGVRYASLNASDFTWSSSSSSVASVDSSGLVKGVALGTATITAKGKYSGQSVTKNIKVVQIPISGATVSVSSQTYTGSALTPVPTVTLNGKTLSSNTDYIVSYANNTNAGTATVTVTGKGNYTGTKSATFTISAANASGAKVSAASRTYTGSSLVTDVTVTLGNKTLVKGTDYTLLYKNNVNAGTATITATFKSNYTGSATGSFVISPADASNAAVTVYNQTYSGSAKTPAPYVSLNKKSLTAGTDYEVSYSNNTNAGTATATVKFKGNYKGSASKDFTIYPLSLSGASVNVANSTYNGYAQKPAPIVVLNGIALSAGTDYELSYSNNTNAGTAKMTVTGKGNYAGTTTKYFTIAKADATGASVSVDDATYTGSYLKPKATVKLDRTTLVEGTDYSLSYSNNRDAGTGTVKVIFYGNYSGTVSKNFTIRRVDASAATVTVSSSFTYTGSALKPFPTVKLDGKWLSEGSDYTLSYQNNVNAGTATVIATFIGNYSGSAKGTFTIGTASIVSASVSVSRQTYTGSPLKPTVTVLLDGKRLVNGRDYDLDYFNNTNAGSAYVVVKGKGNYGSSKKTYFQIDAADASKATVTAAEQAWTGNATEAPVTVKLGNKTLVKGTDYRVSSYSNNVNAGTATVTVTFMGNYTGTAKGTFKINAKDASRAVVKVADQAWTGKALTPAPTVTFGGKTLERGTDYTVAYSNNTNVGTATATVTFKGNYTGKATGTFKITKKGSGNNSGNTNSGNTNSGNTNSGNTNSGTTVGRVTMTRLYNRWSGEHLYTSNASEIKKLVSLGWKNEGTAWVAPSKSSTPVYRLYNPYSGDHHYTTSKKEYDECAEHGWNKEGIAWYSADAKSGVPLYRGFNRYVTVGTHHYTTNWGEMQTMMKNGWKYEGVAWYGLK